MTVNPSTWLSLNLRAPDQLRVFVAQLVQYLKDAFSPANLAQLVSGASQGIKGGALKRFTLDIPAAGGTQPVDVRDAYAIHISINLTGANGILTLSNLMVGTPVSIQITDNSGAVKTFQITATDPAGRAYTVFSKNQNTYANMVTTGVSMNNGQTYVFVGNSSVKGSTPDLELVYQ